MIILLPSGDQDAPDNSKSKRGILIPNTSVSRAEMSAIFSTIVIFTIGALCSPIGAQTPLPKGSRTKAPEGQTASSSTVVEIPGYSRGVGRCNEMATCDLVNWDSSRYRERRDIWTRVVCTLKDCYELCHEKSTSCQAFELYKNPDESMYYCTIFPEGNFTFCEGKLMNDSTPGTSIITYRKNATTKSETTTTVSTPTTVSTTTTQPCASVAGMKDPTLIPSENIEILSNGKYELDDNAKEAIRPNNHMPGYKSKGPIEVTIRLSEASKRELDVIRLVNFVNVESFSVQLKENPEDPSYQEIPKESITPASQPGVDNKYNPNRRIKFKPGSFAVEIKINVYPTDDTDDIKFKLKVKGCFEPRSTTTATTVSTTTMQSCASVASMSDSTTIPSEDIEIISNGKYETDDNAKEAIRPNNHEPGYKSKGPIEVTILLSDTSKKELDVIRLMNFKNVESFLVQLKENPEDPSYQKIPKESITSVSRPGVDNKYNPNRRIKFKPGSFAAEIKINVYPTNETDDIELQVKVLVEGCFEPRTTKTDKPHNSTTFSQTTPGSCGSKSLTPLQLVKLGPRKCRCCRAKTWAKQASEDMKKDRLNVQQKTSLLNVYMNVSETPIASVVASLSGECLKTVDAMAKHLEDLNLFHKMAQAMCSGIFCYTGVSVSPVLTRPDI